MNKRTWLTLCIAALVVAASFAVAQAPKPLTPPPDPRIDKLLEQNDKILKNQDDIIKSLEEVKGGIAQLRRRSS
jgi:hypothetical protein